MGMWMCALWQREALLLRAAALDGWDPPAHSSTANSGGATSASVALAKEAETHAATLHQLLQQSAQADTLLQDVSRLLPLRRKDIPADLAMRLAKAGPASTSAAAAAGVAAGAASEAAAEQAQLKVLRCLQERAEVEAAPEAALAAWLQDLTAFANSALNVCR